MEASASKRGRKRALTSRTKHTWGCSKQKKIPVRKTHARHRGQGELIRKEVGSQKGMKPLRRGERNRVFRRGTTKRQNREEKITEREGLSINHEKEKKNKFAPKTGVRARGGNLRKTKNKGEGKDKMEGE